MKQGLVPLGKSVRTISLCAISLAAFGLSFATPAAAQSHRTPQFQRERIPIDLAAEESSASEREESSPAPGSGSPPERIDLLARQQQEAATTAGEALEAAGDAFGPKKPKPCPKTTDPNEIVVCAAPQDDSEFRVKSSGQLDPNDRSNNDGLPRAGDIAGIAGPGIFTGPATAGGACLPGSCPPEMPIMIDLEAIPEAPAGSDADKIAKGELRVD